MAVVDKKCILLSLPKPPFDPQPFISKSEVLPQKVFCRLAPFPEKLCQVPLNVISIPIVSFTLQITTTIKYLFLSYREHTSSPVIPMVSAGGSEAGDDKGS